MKLSTMSSIFCFGNAKQRKFKILERSVFI